mmetsp:Transcript_5282/g.12582  ORF Transcript_5282/g.12582 Transcript_5282/m.12582 type:complete len:99 (-) Transcript_5282:385-681(-)
MRHMVREKKLWKARKMPFPFPFNSMDRFLFHDTHCSFFRSICFSITPFTGNFPQNQRHKPGQTKSLNDTARHFVHDGRKIEKDLHAQEDRILKISSVK